MSFDAGAVIGRLELNIAGWQKSVEAVKKDQQSLSGLVMRHGDQIKSLSKTFTVVGGLMVASLGAMIKKTADYGDEMDEMHQRTGASVELLTGLDGVLRKNGASAQDLAIGMKFLSGKMVDANSGNKEAIALFKGLGISVTDANGKLRSTTDVLFDVATRFSGMENGAVKTTAAVDLLGRGGMSLIPTLNLGADGLRKEADQAQRLGKVMTAEAAKACSDFNDALVDLKGGLQGVGIQIGSALMPAVKGLVEKITGIVIKVREWAAEHPGLASGLSKVALAAGGVTTVLGPMLYMLPGLVKGWTTLTTVLKLSTAALGASIIGLTALVAAAGVAYDVVTRLTNAKNEAVDADYAAFESNQKLGQKLREVADAAGLTRAEFYQLTLKYDENNAALAMAIKRGTEGKALQEALAVVGKKHAEAIDAQKAAQEKANPLVAAANDLLAAANVKTTTLADSLENKLKPALDLAGSLNNFSDNIRDAFADINAASKLAASALREEWASTGDYTADSMAADLARISEGWNKVPEGAKPAIETTKNYFDGLFNDIATGFGNTIQSWLSGATTFGNFLEGLWGNIKDSFFRMIGQMVAEWAIKFVKKIIDSTVDIAASITKNIAGPVSSIASAAGQAASGFLGALGSVGSIISGITSVIQLLKGPQKQTDVTYWLKLQWELLQNSYNFFVGKLTWMLESIPSGVRYLDSIKQIGYKISTATQQSRDNLKTIASKNYLKDVVGGLKAIESAIGTIGFASGGIAWTPQLAHVAERKPEIIGNLDDYLAGRPLAGIPQSGGGGQSITYATVPIYVGAEKIDERILRIANGRVEWLHGQYKHSNYMIPSRTIGGAG